MCGYQRNQGQYSAGTEHLKEAIEVLAGRRPSTTERTANSHVEGFLRSVLPPKFSAQSETTIPGGFPDVIVKDGLGNGHQHQSHIGVKAQPLLQPRSRNQTTSPLRHIQLGCDDRSSHGVLIQCATPVVEDCATRYPEPSTNPCSFADSLLVGALKDALPPAHDARPSVEFSKFRCALPPVDRQSADHGPISLASDIDRRGVGSRRRNTAFDLRKPPAHGWCGLVGAFDMKVGGWRFCSQWQPRVIRVWRPVCSGC